MKRLQQGKGHHDVSLEEEGKSTPGVIGCGDKQQDMPGDHDSSSVSETDSETTESSHWIKKQNSHARKNYSNSSSSSKATTTTSRPQELHHSSDSENESLQKRPPSASGGKVRQQSTSGSSVGSARSASKQPGVDFLAPQQQHSQSSSLRKNNDNDRNEKIGSKSCAIGDETARKGNATTSALRRMFTTSTSLRNLMGKSSSKQQHEPFETPKKKPTTAVRRSSWDGSPRKDTLTTLSEEAQPPASSAKIFGSASKTTKGRATVVSQNSNSKQNHPPTSSDSNDRPKMLKGGSMRNLSGVKKIRAFLPKRQAPPEDSSSLTEPAEGSLEKSSKTEESATTPHITKVFQRADVRSPTASLIDDATTMSDGNKSVPPQTKAPERGQSGGEARRPNGRHYERSASTKSLAARKAKKIQKANNKLVQGEKLAEPVLNNQRRNMFRRAQSVGALATQQKDTESGPAVHFAKARKSSDMDRSSGSAARRQRPQFKRVQSAGVLLKDDSATSTGARRRSKSPKPVNGRARIRKKQDSGMTADTFESMDESSNSAAPKSVQSARPRGKSPKPRRAQYRRAKSAGTLKDPDTTEAANVSGGPGSKTKKKLDTTSKIHVKAEAIGPSVRAQSVKSLNSHGSSTMRVSASAVKGTKTLVPDEQQKENDLRSQFLSAKSTNTLKDKSSNSSVGEDGTTKQQVAARRMQFRRVKSTGGLEGDEVTPSPMRRVGNKAARSARSKSPVPASFQQKRAARRSLSPKAPSRAQKMALPIPNSETLPVSRANGSTSPEKASKLKQGQQMRSDPRSTKKELSKPVFRKVQSERCLKVERLDAGDERLAIGDAEGVKVEHRKTNELKVIVSVDEAGSDEEAANSQLAKFLGKHRSAAQRRVDRDIAITAILNKSTAELSEDSSIRRSDHSARIISEASHSSRQVNSGAAMRTLMTVDENGKAANTTTIVAGDSKQDQLEDSFCLGSPDESPGARKISKPYVGTTNTTPHLESSMASFGALDFSSNRNQRGLMSSSSMSEMDGDVITPLLNDMHHELTLFRSEKNALSTIDANAEGTERSGGSESQILLQCLTVYSTESDDTECSSIASGQSAGSFSESRGPLPDTIDTSTVKKDQAEKRDETEKKHPFVTIADDAALEPDDSKRRFLGRTCSVGSLESVKSDITEGGSTQMMDRDQKGGRTIKLTTSGIQSESSNGMDDSTPSQPIRQETERKQRLVGESSNGMDDSIPSQPVRQETERGERMTDRSSNTCDSLPVQPQREQTLHARHQSAGEDEESRSKDSTPSSYSGLALLIGNSFAAESDRSTRSRRRINVDNESGYQSSTGSPSGDSTPSQPTRQTTERGERSGSFPKTGVTSMTDCTPSQPQREPSMYDQDANRDLDQDTSTTVESLDSIPAQPCRQLSERSDRVLEAYTESKPASPIRQLSENGFRKLCVPSLSSHHDRTIPIVEEEEEDEDFICTPWHSPGSRPKRKVVIR